MRGSSPHPRGAHHRTHRQRRQDRLIPASAGSTTGSRSIRRIRWAHPRIRGEHHHRPTVRDLRAGLIPASAGSTGTTLCAPPAPRAHPRIRGEHPVLSGCFGPSGGSSPHPRGARPPYGLCDDLPGLIPASAGSTRHPRPPPKHPRAHPRIRGEHRGWSGTRSQPRGSSPHPRGARVVVVGGVVGEWLIPASAGSTSRVLSTLTLTAAHPRIRGEHVGMLRGGRQALGSSPHPRGAHGGRRDHRPVRRLIPASAGSTSCNAATPSIPRAHPRIRGEHTS